MQHRGRKYQQARKYHVIIENVTLMKKMQYLDRKCHKGRECNFHVKYIPCKEKYKRTKYRGDEI